MILCISRYVLLQDENASTSFLLNCSHRWLSVRLDFITGIIINLF